MMNAPHQTPRREGKRASTWGPSGERISWADGRTSGQFKKVGTFTQRFDGRKMPHTPGTLLRSSSLGRPAALRVTRTRQAGGSSPSNRNEAVDASWSRASDNALEVEWALAQAELASLAKRSMGAAETGVRLQALLRRVPGLIAKELGAIVTTNVEGGGTGDANRRELLPLPLPQCPLIRECEITSLYQSTAILGPKAKQIGAQAWQHLIVAALNGLDAHGNCVSFFGPPSEGQALALKNIKRDCENFVADEKARTPTDFTKELGAKTDSYWGDPVFTAEELTLAQVLPTLPHEG